MSRSRWSLANVLRQVRGARNAADRARIKYGKNDVTALLIRSAMQQLNGAEKSLLEAKRRRDEPKTRRVAA